MTLQVIRFGATGLLIEFCIGGPPIQFRAFPPCSWSHVPYPPIQILHPADRSSTPELAKSLYGHIRH